MNYIKHYTHIIIGLIILISVSLISCNQNFDPTLGTYTVSFETMEYGTAEVDKSQVGYNGEVTLTATPQDSYRFVNWTVEGKEVSKENPYTALIIRNTQFRANFEKEIYTIKVTAGEGGIAKTNKTKAEYKEKVSLSATPQEGYSFVNWTVNGEEVSTKNPYAATITANTEFVANFICYKVTVISDEGGVAEASKTQVGHSEQVTLIATPKEGYSFVNWTVNGEEVSKANPYTATITANTEFKANFINYKVSVISSEGGTATANKTQVAPNGQVTLTATPKEGYGFVNWTVNGSEVSKANPYTATITANTEFKANFKATKGVENSHEWIDLGLPSGIKWATCNVGATAPEEYGDYFAWGETQPKDYYYWSTYKYCNGSRETMTKYCVDSSCGTVDNKTTLELADDAARINWGGNWRMPTEAEWQELRNNSNCTWEWTTQNGVNGYKVTSKKNGNSIFLPAAGGRSSGYLNGAGSYGEYWSSSLFTYYSYDAYCMDFRSSSVDWCNSGHYRCYGRSVRALCE